jgi:hypothetical protein
MDVVFRILSQGGDLHTITEFDAAAHVGIGKAMVHAENLHNCNDDDREIAHNESDETL